ncbi:unnamed protein product [Parnassius apollo]|uniref:(apollo) hypothetical protein n=1 Tax=Parnassius apollo TaxID=110799 RepID=A0A8S3WM12_PARAO|nr:unnamed protein product [Parnassius apollo]
MMLIQRDAAWPMSYSLYLQGDYKQYQCVTAQCRIAMSFVDKVVLVTGASSGIGAATAILFAKEGANVTLVGRNEVKLKNVVEQCEKYGKKHLLIKADISNDEEAVNVIKKTIDTFGKLDILVNNAGICRFTSILDENLMKVYDETLNTNLRAHVYITNLAAPHLIKTKGSIVNISSTAGSSISMSSRTLPYFISKAALDQFSRGVALELAQYGVRVNTISPGPVRTDIFENANAPITVDSFQKMTALNRVAEPEEIAELILYLSGDKAKSITGSNYVSDNGYLLKN